MDFSELKALQEKASEWTLVEDRQLCDILEKLHHSLDSNLKNTSKQLHECMNSLSSTSIRAANLSNRFASLSAKQFIENRIHADDFGAYVDRNKSNEHFKQPSSSADTADIVQQETLVRCIQDAVNIGINMLNERFKKIEMKPEDFDEDDDPTFTPDPVYEPYDPHLNRALPFIIGTDEWMRSLNVGLGDKPQETVKFDDDSVVVIGMPTFAQPGIPYSEASAIDRYRSMDSIRDEKKQEEVCHSTESVPSDNSGIVVGDRRISSRDEKATCSRDKVGHLRKLPHKELNNTTAFASNNDVLNSKNSFDVHSEDTGFVPKRNNSYVTPVERDNSERISAKNLFDDSESDSDIFTTSENNKRSNVKSAVIDSVKKTLRDHRPSLVDRDMSHSEVVDSDIQPKPLSESLKIANHNVNVAEKVDAKGPSRFSPVRGTISTADDYASAEKNIDVVPNVANDLFNVSRKATEYDHTAAAGKPSVHRSSEICLERSLISANSKANVSSLFSSDSDDDIFATSRNSKLIDNEKPAIVKDHVFFIEPKSIEGARLSQISPNSHTDLNSSADSCVGVENVDKHVPSKFCGIHNKTSPAFANKLADIFSTSRVSVSGSVEADSSKMKRDPSNSPAVPDVISLLKNRARGPSRRALTAANKAAASKANPTFAPEYTPEKQNVANSVLNVPQSTARIDNTAVVEKASVHQSKEMCSKRPSISDSSEKHVKISVFSSDSDDDIFATSKKPAPVERIQPTSKKDHIVCTKPRFEDDVLKSLHCDQNAVKIRTTEKAQVRGAIRSPYPTKSSFFSSDSDEDIFNASKTPTLIQIAKPATVKDHTITMKPKSMHAFTKSKQCPIKESIFSSEDDSIDMEEESFGKLSAYRAQSLEPIAAVTISKPDEATSIAVQSSSSGHMVFPLNCAESKVSTISSSIFDDDDSDLDIFR